MQKSARKLNEVLATFAALTAGIGGYTVSPTSRCSEQNALVMTVQKRVVYEEKKVRDP
jgi:hypothetical protein